MPLSPDKIGNGIAGTDFDPYAGQENDPFLPNPLVLICFLIGQIYPPALNWMGYFPPHNYRQWHIIEQALTAGWNNGSIKKGVVPAIPACPILWQDVSHYWNFGGILGIIAYELVAYIRVVIVIAGIILATHWNVLTPQKALTIILQQFGVILPS
jgi:hypothetical protein